MRHAPRIGLAAALLLLLLALPGCLDLDQTTKVEREGKGWATLTYVIDLAKAKQFQESMAMMLGGDPGKLPGGDVTEQADPAKVKKLLQGNKHVRIVTSSTKTDEEKKTLTQHVKVAFDSLEDLWKSGLFVFFDAELAKLPNGDYRFTAKLLGKMMPDRPEVAQQLEMFLPVVEPFLTDMRIATTLIVPTEIIETNGTKASNNEVTWTLAYKDIPNPKKYKQDVTFRGTGLDWKPFTVTAKELMKRRKEAQERKPKKEEGPTTPSDEKPSKSEPDEKGKPDENPPAPSDDG